MESRLIVLTDILENARNGVIVLPKEFTTLTKEDGKLINSYQIKTIKFEEGSQLKNIGKMAFYKSKTLEEIDFTNCENLEEIGNFAFCFNHLLNKVTFPKKNKLKIIGWAGFTCSNIEEFNPNNSALESLDNYVFLGCDKLKTIDLSGCKNLKTIGEKAFSIANGELLDFSQCDKIETFENNAIKTKIARFSNKLQDSYTDETTYHKRVVFASTFFPDTKVELYEDGKMVDSFEVSDRKRSNLEVLHLALAKRAKQLKKAFPDVPELEVYDINEFKTKKEMDFFVKSWKKGTEDLLNKLVDGHFDYDFHAIAFLRILGYFGLENVEKNQVEQYKNLLAKKILIAKKIPATQETMNKMANHTPTPKLIKKFLECVIVPHEKKLKLIQEMGLCNGTAKINLQFAMFVVENIDKIFKMPSIETEEEFAINPDFENCNKNLRLATIYRNFDIFLKKSNKKVISRQKNQRFTFDDCTFANMYDKEVIKPGNEELAKLCGESHINQNGFCKLQEWFEQGKEVLKNNQQILDCKPDEETSEITYEFIKKDNPYGLVLGNITNCCQVLQNVGEDCLFIGATHPKSGFMALKYKDDIIAQSWLWYDEKNQVIALDNIEVPSINRQLVNKRVTKETKDCINRFCKNIMETMNNNGHKVQHIIIGKGNTDLNFLPEEYYYEQEKEKMFECPIKINNKKVYSDAVHKGQYFVYKDGKKTTAIIEEKDETKKAPLTQNEITEYEHELDLI